MGVEIPDGSIYFWMYKQGLAQVELGEVLYQLAKAGKDVRDKDIENYWNGWYKHELYRSDRDIMSFEQPSTMASKSLGYDSYPKHPMIGQPEILNRWVPCSDKGKPLIKWSQGCMTKVDAMSLRGSKTLAENLKGTKFIVIDCDGDHDNNELDLETIGFLEKFRSKTHCLSKPKLCWEYGGIKRTSKAMLLNVPASFHLTFTTDRVVPTMHFPAAHIDVIGNRANSLRYLKNKTWNGLDPIPMTPKIWKQIIGYAEKRSR